MKHKKKLAFLILSSLTFSLLSAGLSLYDKTSDVVEVKAYTNHDADTYYQRISDSLTGKDLLSALNKLNDKKRQTTVTYSGMGTSASGPYKYTDYDPYERNLQYDENGQPYGSYVLSFYSGNHTTGFNREHVWPNSRGGSLVDGDIHMTRPTISSENSSRGNSFFVEGMEDQANGWDPAMPSFGEETYRGDAARIIFYSTIANTSLSLVDKNTDNTGNKTMGKLSDLVKWHLQYAPQQREKNRNEGAEYLQGNRNPFIDHPEYVCRIWGKTNSTIEQLCKSDPYEVKVVPTSITLSENEITLDYHQSLTLSVASVVPADANTNVTWSVANSNVATVDKNGLVTGVGEGTTTVTATSSYNSEVSATCIVHVNAPTPKELEDFVVSGPSEAIYEGDTYQLTPVLTPTDAYPDPTILYISSDPQVATVSTKGLITAFKEGTSTITVTAKQNNKTISKTVNISVAKKPIENGAFSISRSSFTGTGGYDWYTWNSGKVTGEAYIYASETGSMQFNGKKTYHLVRNTVEIPGDIISISVKTKKETKNWKLYVSSSVIARGNTSSATDLGSKSVTTSGVTWNVTGSGNHYFYLDYQDSNAAYLDSITVTYGGGEEKTLTGIAITSLPDKVIYNKGESLDTAGMKITATYSDNTVADVTSKVVITPNVFNVTGSVEVQVIYIEDGVEKKASFQVTVNDDAPIVIPVIGISLNVTTKSIDLASEYTFTLLATITPNNATNKAVTWSSSDESVATVSQGSVTVYKEGRVTITATSVDGGFTASCAVIITNSGLAEIDVEYVEIYNPEELYLDMEIGGEYEINAAVKPDNATDKTLEYYSNDEDVVIVDDNGKITAVGVGSTLVEVSSHSNPDAYEEIYVTVAGEELIKIETIVLDSEEITLEVGQTHQIVATVTPNENNDYLIYGTGDEDIAIVSETGLITAVSEGEIYIFVSNSDYSVTESIHLTVTNTYEPPVEPESTPSKGCGGNIVTTSVIISFISLVGIGLVLMKKKKARG